MSFTNPRSTSGLTFSEGVRLSSTSQQQQVSGVSVAFLGDINGDTLGDFGLGDPYVDFAAAGDAGMGQAFFGKFAFTANLGTGTANADRTRVIGDSAFSLVGSSLSGAGDVNGDGRADWIVGGQSLAANGVNNSGGAVLVFGAAPNLSGVVPDLSVASTAGRAVRLNGLEQGSLTGASVSGAGDVNGDGYADILVGALGADANGLGNSGSALLIFGGPSLPGTLDLGNLGAAGLRLNGVAGGDNLGAAVAGVGDLNGDGFADFALGASGADPSGRTGAGSLYVVFGAAGGGLAGVDPGNLGARGFRVDGAAGPVEGAALGDQLGASVAAAGDVNGDGFMDLIVGAPNASPLGREFAGAAFLVFGKAGGWGNIDLATATPASGVVRIAGAAAGDQAGTSVSGWGDVNGDGLSDILVGSPGANSGAGSAFLILGKTTGWADIDLASSDALRFNGAANSRFGTSVALNGDANGDGFADALIGAAPRADAGQSRATQAWVFFSQSPDGEPEGGEANFVGTTLADSVAGGPGADILRGGAGADLILGREGGDAIFAGAGNDRLNGGGGENFLDGEGGTDTVDYSWVTADMTVSLGAGTAVGGGVSDTIRRVEALLAGTGNDKIGGDPGANALRGGQGNDQLFGDAGDDSLFGEEGDDVLYSGAGADLLAGGAGSDKYQIDNAGDVVVELAGDAGLDAAFVLGSGWTVAANIEVTYLSGAASLVAGSAAGDVIAANAALGTTINGGGGNDELFGRAQSDVLRGEAGNDILRGDAGDDSLSGGEGTDQLVGGAGADVFVYNSAAFGNDEIFDFARSEGDKLDFRGSGLALGSTLQIQDFGTASQVFTQQGGVFHIVTLYGVGSSNGTSLQASDFLFA